MSLLPSSKVPSALIKMEDTLIHLGIYWVLASLVFWGRHGFSFKPISITTALIWFAILSGFGWLLEGLQEWIGVRRSFEVSDGLANSIGVILGLVFHGVLSRIFPPK